VATDNVLGEDLLVERLGLGVVTGETLLRVGNVHATVRGTLHGTEQTGTGRGAAETDIEVGLERAGLVVTEGLGDGESPIGLGNTLVLVGEAELGEGTAGGKETGSVGSSPVGKTVLDAVAGELLGGSVDKNKVTLSTVSGDPDRPTSILTWSLA
jgi:hypothetical protein